MTGIKPCPFCGRPCNIEQDELGDSVIYCLSGEYDEGCAYSYGHRSNDEDAIISAHNRVSAAIDLAELVQNAYPDLYDKVMP